MRRFFVGFNDIDCLKSIASGYALCFLLMFLGCKRYGNIFFLINFLDSKFRNNKRSADPIYIPSLAKS